jgi:hypothetical protein
LLYNRFHSLYIVLFEVWKNKRGKDRFCGKNTIYAFANFVYGDIFPTEKFG